MADEPITQVDEEEDAVAEIVAFLRTLNEDEARSVIIDVINELELCRECLRASCNGYCRE